MSKSLAREFNQDYLVSIDESTFRKIKRAVEDCRLLSFTKGVYQGGDKAMWCIKTEQSINGIYLLVVHFEPSNGRGLKLAHKVDMFMYQAFLGLKEIS